MSRRITIVGGGLAGAEAAWQAARLGVGVDLLEMRPQVMTEAHQGGLLAEMVCSNSLGAEEATSASGLLKRELRRLGSLFLRHAEGARVPAGGSLAVDRQHLAAGLTAELESRPGVRLVRGEVRELPAGDGPLIVASGPLTSPALAQSLTGLTQRKNLYFYDATCPLLRAESIDFTRLFAASRYGKGAADFWNIPLDRAQYEAFSAALAAAETAEVHEFEKRLFFDACLPLEEIARSGPQSLAYGPLKPVGLVDPRSGARPYAVVQLRQDDLLGKFYQLVGFQTRLKHGEQRRIFRALPGLENAEFERFGRMHRNTYVNAPLILDRFSRCRQDGRVYFAGQISGVEGYVESVASGLACGLFAAWDALGREKAELPAETALGALLAAISGAGWRDFRPSKFSFGLLPDRGDEPRDKKRKKELKAERAGEALERWIAKAGI